MWMEDKLGSMSVGDSANYIKNITNEDIETFAALKGDKNHIHLEEDYATQTQFGRRIAHGLLATA